MKKYIYVILFFSVGCTDINNKSVTQAGKEPTTDTLNRVLPTTKVDTSKDHYIQPFFVTVEAELIDSISDPKAYLYNQKYYGNCGNLFCDAQFLLLQYKSKIDTIEVEHFYGLPFSEGKIIQYFSYKKNSKAIVVELTFARCHGLAGWCASNTFWYIFDLESKKRIFYCTPYSYSEEWDDTDTLDKPNNVTYDKYSIEIKNSEIVINQLTEAEKSDENKNVTYNTTHDLKFGTYVWKDTSFVLTPSR